MAANRLFKARGRRARAGGALQRKTTARVPWGATLTATLIMCAAAWLLARQIAPAPRGELRAIPLPCSSDQRIEPLGDGALFSDGAQLHALDGRGRQIWQHPAGTGSGFRASEGGVCVWLDRKLTLLSGETGATLYTGSTKDPILSSKLGTMYAAVQTGSPHDGELYVIKRDGGEVERIELRNQTLIDYGFFADGTLLWTLSLDTEGTVPKSAITTRLPGRSLTGTVEQTREVVYKAFFLANDLIAVGDAYLRAYNYQGRELREGTLVYGWHLMGEEVSGGVATLAFAPTSQSGANAPIRDVRILQGNLDRTVRMPFPCFAVTVRGGTVYGFNREYAIARAPSDDRARVYALPIRADRLIGMTANGSAILASGGDVYLVPAG